MGCSRRRGSSVGALSCLSFPVAREEISPASPCAAATLKNSGEGKVPEVEERWKPTPMSLGQPEEPSLVQPQAPNTSLGTPCGEMGAGWPGPVPEGGSTGSCWKPGKLRHPRQHHGVLPAPALPAPQTSSLPPPPSQTPPWHHPKRAPGALMRSGGTGGEGQVQGTPSVAARCPGQPQIVGQPSASPEGFPVIIQSATGEQ